MKNLLNYILLLLLGPVASQRRERDSINNLKKNVSGTALSDDFCKRQTQGSRCVSTPQGLIPIASNMISTLIVFPENGQSVSGREGFDIVFDTINFISGKSLDLTKQYLSLPQSLDTATGMVEGMQSISIQQLQNSLLEAPDGNIFSFSEILNTSSNIRGQTRFTLAINPLRIKTRGLHRICTLALSRSGMAAIMPVAQRGAQDDCIRVFIE